METLVRVAQFLLSLCLLVLFHELGHYVAARAFGARVDKFYVFFNPWFSLFKRKIGDTEFGIGWIPLGGYAKIAGMVDESFDTRQLASAPQPYEFRSKRPWQRLLIVSGGVLVNLLLAWGIYTVQLYTGGDSYVATSDIRYGISPDSVGLSLGFLPGDRLRSVNGRSVERYDAFYTQMLLSPGATVEVERGGELVCVALPASATASLVQGMRLFGPRIPFVVGQLVAGGPAERAGYQPGDSLVAIEGVAACFFDELRAATLSHRSGLLRTTVMRNGLEQDIVVEVPAEGLIGIVPVSDARRFFNVSQERYGLLEAVGAGAARGFRTLANYARSIKLIFMPGTGASQSVGGFISIGKIFPGEWDWQAFWSLTAFLSIALALMNFLPVPGLDGGHAVFILYEMVTRRKPSQRFLIKAQMVGFLLLVALVLYANVNDIVRLFE